MSARESAEEKGVYVEENRPVWRLIEEWKEDFVGSYIIFLSLQLASLAISAVEGGRGRERACS